MFDVGRLTAIVRTTTTQSRSTLLVYNRATGLPILRGSCYTSRIGWLWRVYITASEGRLTAVAAVKGLVLDLLYVRAWIVPATRLCGACLQAL